MENDARKVPKKAIRGADISERMSPTPSDDFEMLISKNSKPEFTINWWNKYVINAHIMPNERVNIYAGSLILSKLPPTNLIVLKSSRLAAKAERMEV